MSFLFGRRAAEPAAGSTPPAMSNLASTYTAPQGGASSLELIHYNADTGKFELGHEALNVLRNTKGPVGVVAVAGRARQGKSFILNQLLGRSGGFTVAPTHRPCTKGLWMWSAPVVHTGPDGSKYNLVLLDTEGIDAYDQTAQYSTQIFSLAVLLSSLFIYNQLGPIDEAAMDRLSLVTEMTKHIRVRASSGAAEDPSELAAFTPAFIWLLRDFYLKLEDEGRKVSPREYLETALQLVPVVAAGGNKNNNAAVDAKNQVRTGIKSLFPDRDCFTLVRPVNDEDELARLDSLPPSAMRTEFRQGIAQFTKLVLLKAQPKRLGAQVLTGPLLAGLAEAYVVAINGGAVPNISTAWQGVAESECRRGADAAEQAYLSSFPDNIPADETTMEVTNQKALVEAQRVFDDIAIGEESIKKANEARWKQACAARYNELKQRKLATAALACERAINDATARLSALVRNEATTVDDLRREVAAFEAAYKSSNEASGPTKWPRFAQFMRESYAGAVRDVVDRQDKKREAAAALAAQRATQAEARLTSFESEVSSLRSRVTEAEAALARERQALASERAKSAALETQLAQLRQEMQSERARLTAEADQRAQSMTSPLKQRLAGATSELEALRRQAAASLTETRTMSERVAAVAAERDAAQAQLAVAQTAKSAAEQRITQLEGQLQTLRFQNDTLQQQHQTLQSQQQQQQQQQRAMQQTSWNIGGGGGGTGLGRIPEPTPAEGVIAEVGGGDDVMAEVLESPGPAAVTGGGGAVGGSSRVAAGGEAVVLNTAKMTINDMKQWLMGNGQEAVAWELANKRAKKAEWEAAVKNAL